MTAHRWVVRGAGPDGFDIASLDLNRCQLDLELTLDCGQAFRWKRGLPNHFRPDTAPTEDPWHNGDPWHAVVRERLVTLWRKDGRLFAGMYPGPFDSTLMDAYLDLRVDLEAVCSEISVDPHITAAAQRYPGLRILQQEPWEALISFILSQWSNVTRISNQVEAISRACGAEIAPGYFAFPRPEAIAAFGTEALRRLGMGYRAPFVLRAAQQCMNRGADWLNTLADRSYPAAHRSIVRVESPGKGGAPGDKIHGVGAKVADCVLLFSLGHYEAFPVDVHVRRAMERWYGEIASFTGSYESVAGFGREHFGRYAGYAQQYLFHRQRTGEKAPSTRGRGTAESSPREKVP
ncbi:MAG: hypothetical protein LC772_07255 [Chloroflexi bacterium]|nr:hypothetical protein [Chloroflexota bacterium]